MGIAEIRDAFEAYGSGKLSEFELRDALRTALRLEPESVSTYVAMVAALRNRKLISAELQAAVLSDIRPVTGHDVAAPSDSADVAHWDTPSTLQGLTKTVAHQAIPSVPATTGSRASTGPGSGRGTGPSSAWDTQERLAEPEAQVMIGLVLRERFELVEELGRGGMGVVYKALDQREVENKGRDPYVAIKVLNEEFKRHPESARALQRESKKSMRLAHPNIVLVRDFDRDSGNVFMVMELLNGQPLDRLQRNQYPDGMPIDMVVDIVRGLGAGLSYAHQQGIVHADFKPSNAFVTNQNVVKVLDFGVARAALALDRADSTLFDAAKLNAVTPAYASIEMLIGEAPDPRDDIYALACVTYLLLTGRHPYSGIDAIRAREVAMLPARIEGIADHQWRAIYWALTFERASRTATVNEFVSQFCTPQDSRATKRAGAARRDLRVSAAAPRAVKPADVVVKDRWKAVRDRGTAVKEWGTAARDRWAAARVAWKRWVAARQSAISRASAAAGTAIKQRWHAVGTRVSSLAGAAARKPWLIAGPAGVALAVAIALLLPREWYAQMLAAGSALVRPHPTSVASVPAPEAPPSSTQSEQPEAAGNPPENNTAEKDSAPQNAGASTAAAADEQRVAAVNPPAVVVAKAEQPAVVDAARSQAAVDGIGKLKQQLADQVAAGDVDGANATANALRRARVSGSYLATELPQQLIASYRNLAKKQLIEGNPELALQTIAAGRRKYASAPDLKNLEITYDRVAEEIARLNMAPALSVRDHSAWIEQIRQLSGEDFPDIDQLLARTLANDIADQRAKGDRPTVVANLLQSGRKVFPDYAGLLEQGKAGVLDPAQILVLDEPVDGADTPAEKPDHVAKEIPVAKQDSAGKDTSMAKEAPVAKETPVAKDVPVVQAPVDQASVASQAELSK
jgi:serine/threonine protein kinase